MTNVNGNWKKSLKKQTKSAKKWAVGIGKKTTGEQRFLGKTLPKALFKTAKFAFKHPISATALAFVPSAMKKITGRQRGLQWAQYRQYNKKGRKII